MSRRKKFLVLKVLPSKTRRSKNRRDVADKFLILFLRIKSPISDTLPY
jgi:hypothetical protein